MATVRELHEALTELLENHAGEDVYIASQPSWPFENYISELRLVEFVEDHPFVTPEDGIDIDLRECAICGEQRASADHQKTHRIYIVEGGQKGYLPGEAKDELGW
ncbi:hypothetical protein SEA_WOLLYPOG_32 [Arthrobacter phage Wollypog]|uniref:Uncharacterized protein n=1 Tax=Arthrobacter phage Wollypog TaxID=2790985 RepID=A0A7T3N3H8_9CAUD|nr:hypothetical protein PP291_gp32 [Arthrobacter phage Wollypog]QPX62584.1 hypothetical protein SEA_WOLLYPOG_32 [Arthrobacter phage Wollypog]